MICIVWLVRRVEDLNKTLHSFHQRLGIPAAIFTQVMSTIRYRHLLKLLAGWLVDHVAGLLHFGRQTLDTVHETLASRTLESLSFGHWMTGKQLPSLRGDCEPSKRRTLRTAPSLERERDTIRRRPSHLVDQSLN